MYYLLLFFIKEKYIDRVRASASAEVDCVIQTIRMIEAQRAYEGASKALMTHDEQTGRLITSYSRG